MPPTGPYLRPQRPWPRPLDVGMLSCHTCIGIKHRMQNILSWLPTSLKVYRLVVLRPLDVISATTIQQRVDRQTDRLIDRLIILVFLGFDTVTKIGRNIPFQSISVEFP